MANRLFSSPIMLARSDMGLAGFGGGAGPGGRPGGGGGAPGGAPGGGGTPAGVPAGTLAPPAWSVEILLSSPATREVMEEICELKLFNCDSIISGSRRMRFIMFSTISLKV
ncbi:MAG: hypothetical protein Kow0069_01960 [Promethearchaeota archaeon]